MAKIEMAIAYDFDGTLAPGNMQEHQFLPEINISSKNFWDEVKEQTKKHQGDEVLIYMHQMLRHAENAKIPVRRTDFKKCGENLRLFAGVEGWFDRINNYGKEKGICVKHYMISSGNEEIFDGTSIASKFSEVFASKFMFDHNDTAKWPALAVNYTNKTQYLFRINKGAFDLSDNSTVNRYVEKHERPVPFENMVFIGDGLTDIPCFRLVKEEGGLSIAVYEPKTSGGRSKANKHLADGRVHCAVPADYNEDKQLDQIIKSNIDVVASRSHLRKLLLKNKR